MQPRFAEHVDREGVRTEQAGEGGIAHVEAARIGAERRRDQPPAVVAASASSMSAVSP